MSLYPRKVAGSSEISLVYYIIRQKLPYKLEKHDLANSLRLYQTRFRLIEVEFYLTYFV